ncbi:MAG: imidazole glycerol phosphate synthase subunit HisH [Desulfosarcina sp.]|nr:imidazole glycerol phosphate synthase subunit HisH [Desulfosarcina sp.]
MITLLDYGAGNVRSVINAIEKLGERVTVAKTGRDILSADKLLFPGVGSFGSMMSTLRQKRFVEPLVAYIGCGRPFFGICLGMQALFEGSDEAPEEKGLCILPGRVKRFDVDLAIPHIGWNGISVKQPTDLFYGLDGDEKFYFVHSYHVVVDDPAVVLTTTDYGYPFVSAVQRGSIQGTQFHPEKSGASGLTLLENFIRKDREVTIPLKSLSQTRLAKRIIACLDVRANDRGDLVVTKGDQYDVREDGNVRNLGKPVELAGRYFEEGADEVTFLNITGFRDFPLQDMPMIQVLKETSRNVFVPLTIGGGIRDFTDKNGRAYTALQVAAEYFRSGADKVSIGSDAVVVVEEYLKTGKMTGQSAIEQISYVYGNQAVVISIDPRRVYVDSPEQTSEKLGAGEILLNCIDRDGTNMGFDIELINAVKQAVTIPVIASSGAGCEAHFAEVFEKTNAESALAAGIFHRREVPISAVKQHLKNTVEVRL